MGRRDSTMTPRSSPASEALLCLDDVIELSPRLEPEPLVMLSPRSASRLHCQVDLFSAKCGQLKACRAQCESSAQEKISQVKTELRSSEVEKDLLKEKLQTAKGRDEQQQSEIEDLGRQLDSAHTDQAELMHTQKLAYDTLRVELAACELRESDAQAQMQQLHATHEVELRSLSDRSTHAMCELEIKETISADYAAASEQFVRVLESNKALSDRVDTQKERISQLDGQLAGSETSRMQVEQLIALQTSTIEQFQNLQQQLPAAGEASLELATLRGELAKVTEELAHAHGVSKALEAQLTSQSVLREQRACDNSVAEENEYRKTEVARLQDDLAKLQCTQVELENQLVEVPLLRTTIAELQTNKRELSEELLVLTRKNQELERHGLQLVTEMADQQQKQSEIQLSGLKSQNTRLKEQLSKQHKQLSKHAAEMERLQSELGSSCTQKDVIQLELTQAKGQITD